MNSKERMARAMHRQEADHVPVMWQLALGHYFLNMRHKYRPHEIWFGSEAFADALLTLRERYRFDGILINIPGREPDWMKYTTSIRDTPEGELIIWKDGSRTLVPPDDNPNYEPGDSGLLLHPDYQEFNPDTDIKRLDRWTCYIWGVYHTPYMPGATGGLLLDMPDYVYRTVDLVRAAVSDAVSIHGEVFSPFTHFMELFGYEQALTGLALDPGKAEAILDRLVDTVVEWGAAQAERGCDAILISSAFAGGGFISARMYTQFVLPYERKVIDALHARFSGLPVYIHTCGKLGDRLELMVESHTDGVDTLDPPPLGDTTLADAKARIGDKLFIKGNMNPVALLVDQTETQVLGRARSALEVGKPGGGYILSTACSVAPRVAPWKLEMLADIANEYGRYDR